MKGIRGILLAAGSSSRFGADKLLYPLPSGARGEELPIAVASALNLLATLPGSLAVVRPGSSELEAALRRAGCEVTVCPNAQEGMGASLAHAIAESGAAQGWMVALADMPYIMPGTITALKMRLEQGALIVVPVYRGRRGHPVGFSAGVRDELLALRGDEGARAILQRRTAALQRLNVDDPGIHRDIDTPGDLTGNAS